MTTDPGSSMSELDEVALRYDTFMGDITFIANDVDFSACWGWVPVLDFAVGFATVVAMLAATKEGSFHFTESDAALHLTHSKLSDGNIEISSNYTSHKAIVNHTELRIASYTFRDKVLSDLVIKYPELKTNQTLLSWIKENSFLLD